MNLRFVFSEKAALMMMTWRATALISSTHLLYLFALPHVPAACRMAHAWWPRTSHEYSCVSIVVQVIEICTHSFFSLCIYFLRYNLQVTRLVHTYALPGRLDPDLKPTRVPNLNH